MPTASQLIKKGVVMNKKVLISQAWQNENVPRLNEFIAQLEAKGCDVTLFPSTKTMAETDLLEWLPGFYAHICCRADWTANVMNQLKDLKIIARLGTGFETVDIPAATQRGIVVTITPGAGAYPTAECAFAMLLSLSIRLHENDRQMRAGVWSPRSGNSIYGKTLGIVGLGLIGKEMAKLVCGFNMKVLAHDLVRDDTFAKQHNIQYVSLPELLKASDFVSLSLPYSKSTRHLIGEKEFAMMKDTACIINVSRGGILDEKALYHALDQKIIIAAGLDVFDTEQLPLDNPLRTLENVILTPHMAGSSKEGLDGIVGMATQSVIDLIEDRVPLGIKNPEVLSVSNG